MAGVLVPRSLQSVRERGGAEGHLASSIAQRHPGSRAGGQDTALDPLQGLLNHAWSLRLALWYTGCTKEAPRGLSSVRASGGGAQFWPCDEGVRGEPQSNVHQRQSPSFPTHCVR